MTPQRSTGRHLNVLAFRCDAAGTIEEVVADDLQLGRQLGPGDSLLDIVDSQSHSKARQFLSTVVARHAASGWELNLVADGLPFPAVFTGAMQQDRLFIVAGRSARDITNVVETLEQIGNEQLNAFRMAFRDQRDSFDRTIQKDAGAYEVLSRLNNDLANAQRELSEKSRDLERLNEEKNRFLGMAAHDLRNPLSVILGYATLLATNEEDEDVERMRMIEGIARSSRFMLELINDLLDVSQIEAGQRDVQISTFDSVEVVREVVAAYEATAAAKRIGIALDAPDQSITVTTDGGKLRQVIANLVGNAIKFSNAGTAVRVCITGDAQYLRLEVQDHGIGIPEAQQKAIFEPFVHLDTTGTAGERSTGLGLSIVAQLVDILSGRITLESTVGEGSTFHLTLPLTIASRTR